MIEAETAPPIALAPRPLSRLSYLIMGLNLIAVVFLIGGIFYLDRFKKDITNSETEIFATEAQLYAALLSDNAFSGARFNAQEAETLLKTFSEQKVQRLRLFSDKGQLLIDTKTPDRLPTEPLEKLAPGMIGSAVDFLFSAAVRLSSVTFELPRYPGVADGDINSFPDAPEALQGQMSLSAWSAEDGGLILSTSMPVLKNGTVRGALLVTRADTRIERTFSDMRIDILKFFFLLLLVTLSFSLYLSAAIGHPLRKLALAAQAIRANQGGTDLIPDLAYRDDEIGELSEALRDMTEALQERIESIERFAADVSHELKNPLTSMRSAIETLDKISKPADRERLMEIIHHDLVRMDRLITDISRASRLDVELLRDVFKPLDIRQIILPLAVAYQRPYEYTEDIEKLPPLVICRDFETPVMVAGQSVRLSQVFQNLIENALSFTPPGKPVEISIKRGPEFVNIWVEDYGPGIPENRLEKIFERFYSERPAAEAFGSHSGLGLSIVRQIVQAHGGTIRAQNRVDENGNIIGARFMVKLRPA